MGNVDVLIIDDDIVSCSLLKECVETLGLVADFYLDGRKALESMQHTKPHLIILDVYLPEMDGFEIINKLKKDKIYIIGVSSNPIYANAIKSLGANEAYTKDNLDKIIAAINSYFLTRPSSMH